MSARAHVPVRASADAHGSEREGIVCIVSKAPRRGAVKTRLAATIGDVNALLLASAFLEDTVAMVRGLSWARCVLAVDELAPTLPFAHDLWLQGDGNLGARLDRIVRRALDEAPFVIVIGSDTPGLPSRIIEQAKHDLAHHDATIGPALDGGFYLLGLRRCPDRVFDGVPWSTADAFLQMRAALSLHRCAPSMLAPWFDIDDADDLARLSMLLRDDVIAAPATRNALRYLGSG